MSNTAIKAEGLSKQYVLGGAENHHQSFREMVTGALQSPFRKFRRLRGDHDDRERFWALDDLNFTIEAGQKVGVIGHNGAGKSTLLKVLSRITLPTKGQVTVAGRVSSLLEVGTGFHPELTGRENIYLNGSILGMTREQIRRRFDEIVAFAEVERFVDTPVKRFSSGMYVRLAFSVAAHLDSDVLIVDEVLAVGDQRFQDRSLGKLDDLGDQGRTVLFVSHNLSMVSRLCPNTMLLEQGRLITLGESKSVLSEYSQRRRRSSGSKAKGFFGSLIDQVDVQLVDLVNRSSIANPLEPLEIEARVTIHQAFEGAKSTLTLVRDGVDLVSQHSSHTVEPWAKGEHHLQFTFPAKFLSPGDYSVKFGISDAATGRWVWGEQVLQFEVAESWDNDYQPFDNMGVVNYAPLALRKEG